MLFTVLRVVYKIGSALGGGFGFLLLYTFSKSHSVLLLPYAALFVGGAVLLLWLAKQLPNQRPPRLRNKSFVNRVLNALYD